MYDGGKSTLPTTKNSGFHELTLEAREVFICSFCKLDLQDNRFVIFACLVG